MIADESWDSALDPIVIATEAVAEKRQDILRVVHQEGHGGWQVYDDVEPLTSPVVILKEEILKLDSTLKEVTEIKVGYEAYRSDRVSAWKIRRIAR